MDLVDWDLATATARRLVRPGPDLDVSEATAVVRQLRTLADEATGHVVAYTGLVPDPSLRTANVVLDRGDWAASNVAGMQITLAPLLAQLDRARSDRSGKHAAAGLANGVTTAVGRRVSGVEVGTLLSLLSSRVLGQYEPFVPAADGDGRLLLVAPNIVEVERRLAVDPRDFRMWVCLHEQTHRVQFTGVPWLKDHMIGLITHLAESLDLDPTALVGRLRDGVRAAVGELSHKGGDAGADRDFGLPGVLALVQTPAQREAFAAVQATMTVLEGHADHVMDAVGPQVVPSVAQIRERFEDRRARPRSVVDLVLRRVLGMNAKLAQYKTGGAFCQEVRTAGGAEALTALFAAPENLPDAIELKDPARWLARVGVPV